MFHTSAMTEARKTAKIAVDPHLNAISCSFLASSIVSDSLSVSVVVEFLIAAGVFSFLRFLRELVVTCPCHIGRGRNRSLGVPPRRQFPGRGLSGRPILSSLPPRLRGGERRRGRELTQRRLVGASDGTNTQEA